MSIAPSREIAAEGHDSAYPYLRVFAMELEMLPRDFLFDTACDSSELGCPFSRCSYGIFKLLDDFSCRILI